MDGKSYKSSFFEGNFVKLMIICNGGDLPLNIHIMNNLFQSKALEEIYDRIDQLSPSSQRNWGKMNVAQMMAHCSKALQMAVGGNHQGCLSEEFLPPFSRQYIQMRSLLVKIVQQIKFS